MDAIVFKVRQDGKVIDKAVQIAVGLNEHGRKEVLGMWICQNESAAFWMQVLTTLKSRGLQDILVTATDNLKIHWSHHECFSFSINTDLYCSSASKFAQVCGLER